MKRFEIIVPSTTALVTSLLPSLLPMLLPMLLLGLPRPVAGQEAAVQEPAVHGAVDAGRAVTADASIKIWNGGGSLRVEGWPADSIHVTGETEAGEFFFFGRGAAAKLGLQGREEDVHGRLVVRVPENATVWIRTGTADVAVRGLGGSLDVHSVSGAVDVEGRPANLYAESMGGDVHLRVESEIVRAQAGTGRLVFSGTAGDLTLSTVSGDLAVETPDLRRGRLTTVDGDIRFDGAVGPGGSLAGETHAGDVTLRLPVDLAADFELSTFEGRIRAPLADASDVGPVGASGRRVLRFETGTGGAEVTVRSYSGSIELETDSEED